MFSKDRYTVVAAGMKYRFVHLINLTTSSDVVTSMMLILSRICGRALTNKAYELEGHGYMSLFMT